MNLLSPYAVSKSAGEGYCHAFYESYDLPTAVVRYSNVFGPGQTPENPYCGVVAKLFDSAMTSKPLQIHGDGEQTRDYTFVEDAVTATLSAAVSPKATGQAYNVGTGVETSVNGLARLIMEITGTSSKLEYLDRRDIDNIRRRVVNIEKIRRELRWAPAVTLEQGLKKTHAWLLDRAGLARA
jgi:nucleoside-diphosphate-sugar epimerase